MKMRTIIFQLLLLLSLLVTSAEAQPRADTVTVHSQQVTAESAAEDESFKAFLLLFALFVISIMLGIAAAGFFIGILLFGSLLLLTSLSIMSISLWAAYYKRSLSAGYRTFLYLVCPIVGVTIGVAVAFIVAKLFAINISSPAVLIGGGVAGLLGGLMLAFVIGKLSIIAGQYVNRKFIQTNRGNR